MRAPTAPSDSDRYCSPEEILDLVLELFGEIDLDPWHDENSIVPARQRFDLRSGQDAFALRWARPGVRTIYSNGPFSQVKRWARLCREAAVFGCEVVMVGPASPGAAYWQETIWPFATVCFPCPRIAFLGIDGQPIRGAREDHAVCYFGSDHERFAEVFRVRGPVVRALGGSL